MDGGITFTCLIAALRFNQYSIDLINYEFLNRKSNGFQKMQTSTFGRNSRGKYQKTKRIGMYEE